MDPPKTRRETKKSAKEKRADVYSARHARLIEQNGLNQVKKTKEKK